MIAATFGTLSLVWSATARHWVLAVSAGKGRRDEGGDHRAPALSSVGQDVTYEVDATALPR